MDSTEEIEERFAAYLRSHRLRKTPERFAILRMACGLKAHFDIDLLHAALDKEGYHVSRATVYNTVDILCKVGILQRLFFDSTRALYELAGRNHLHLFCTSCGRIREIADSQLLPSPPKGKFPTFQADYATTCVYGTCQRCQKRLRGASRKTEADTR